MKAAPRLRNAGPLIVALVALVLTTALVSRALSVLDWDATAFVGFGAEVSETRQYAEELLDDVFLRGQLGHDGKYFFIQASDPWIVDPSNNADVLDFPVYRSQRMLYPLLAGGLGLLGPEGIVWGLLVVNVVGMALGTLGAAKLARALGGSSWWGLAFVGNVGLIFTLTIDGADIVATACAIWAVAYLYEGNTGAGIVLLAAAALTREVMLLSALGVAIWLWTEDRKRHAILAIGVPALALGAWEAYLRFTLGPDTGSPRAIGLPLVGLVRVLPDWVDDPIALAAGLCIIAFSVIFTIRWWAGRSLLSWAFVGFVPLALMMTTKVWMEIFDFTRAVAPLLTATILLVFSRRPTELGQRMVGVMDTDSSS